MNLLKKILPIILVSSSLCGCAPKEKGMTCLSNANFFFEEKVNGNQKTLTGTIDNIKALMDLNIPFLIYLHKPNCVWCDKFAPILDEYLSNYETLVVDVPYEILTQFAQQFGTYYFENNQINFPYLGIVKGYNKCKHVENEKYMQTKLAFQNYMTSELKNSQLYYSDSSIENCKNIQEFTYISLKNTDKTSLNLYSTKVQEIALDSSKNIVISTANSTGLELIKIDKNHEVKEKTQITNESEPDLILEFF